MKQLELICDEASGMTASDDRRPLARVLVADDNDLCRSLVVSMLEDMGCQVDAAADGAAAVEAAAQTQYDLIFLDGVMPEMGGIEVARAIRQSGGPNGAVPIVGITGNPVQVTKDECLAAGMDEYLQKPVGREIYRQAVARWVFGEARPSTRPERPG